MTTGRVDSGVVFVPTAPRKHEHSAWLSWPWHTKGEMLMVLQYAHTTVDPEKVYRLLGRRQGTTTRSRSVERKLRRLNDVASGLISPRLTFKAWEVGSTARHLQLKNGTVMFSPKLARTVRGSTDIICFVATIGRAIEHEIQTCMDNRRLSDGYLLDAIGSTAVEQMVQDFCVDMQRWYGFQKRAVTHRFSPGYCDWPVTEQQKLFQLIAADRIGVTLSESSLMQPRKSISGVFGVQPVGSLTTYQPYVACTDCRRQDCAARRADYRPSHDRAANG